MGSIVAPSKAFASPSFSAFPSLCLPDVAAPCFSPEAAGRSTGVCGEAAGLVSYETSGTFTHSSPANPPNNNLILVDRVASRLKRLRSTVLTAARLHIQQKSKWRVLMVTLTYAPEFEYQPHQLAQLVRHIRQYLKRKNIEMRYAWVMEFTKRGRPHYHLLVWLPLGLTLPKPDKRGWWPYGMTKIEWARNAIGYIAKYASKADSLHRPELGARMHGNGGLTGEALLEQRWWHLPTWAREFGQPSDRLCRRVGGGILNPETGEVFLTPWRVFFKGGQVYIYRVDEGGICSL